MQAISQINLQKVVTTFQLQQNYFDKFALVQNVPHESGITFGGKQMIIHQERIPLPVDIPPPKPKPAELPSRPHRLDKHKLYSPSYL
jgi:hypothetical protein